MGGDEEERESGGVDVPELPRVQVEVKQLGKVVAFPPRGSTSEAKDGVGDDAFVCVGVELLPQDCGGPLSKEGRRAPWGQRSGGVWRGGTEGTSPTAAAALVAPLLEGTVGLDACGLLASAGVASLRFLPARAEDEDAAGEVAREAAAAAMGCSTGSLQAFRLAGARGQVLSHDADLWLAPQTSGSFDFNAVLRLQPLAHYMGKGNRFHVARRGPMGLINETWEEVPMVELPSLLRLMMGNKSAATALAAPGENFLVDEEDETLVIHGWQRTDTGEASEVGAGAAFADLEQLLWYDAVASLAETPPCAEAPVPMQRIRLADEGVCTREELAESKAVSDWGVSKEDAARLGSLAFLRQYVTREVLEEEVLPRLLPGQGGTVRVLSIELSSRDGEESATASGGPAASKPKQPRPKSIDDLFDDAADFRAPAPWRCAGSPEDGAEDPLARHELTSVVLLSERSGFALTFHSLQAVDPCAL